MGTGTPQHRPQDVPGCPHPSLAVSPAAPGLPTPTHWSWDATTHSQVPPSSAIPSATSRPPQLPPWALGASPVPPHARHRALAVAPLPELGRVLREGLGKDRVTECRRLPRGIGSASDGLGVAAGEGTGGDRS